MPYFDDAGARRALLLVRALRAAIVVTCLTTAGVAWTMGAHAVFGLALVIVAEEAWETSVVIAALRRQLHGVSFPLHRS
jgi:hypothetical protein